MSKPFAVTSLLLACSCLSLADGVISSVSCAVGEVIVSAANSCQLALNEPGNYAMARASATGAFSYGASSITLAIQLDGAASDDTATGITNSAMSVDVFGAVVTSGPPRNGYMTFAGGLVVPSIVDYTFYGQSSWFIAGVTSFGSMIYLPAGSLENPGEPDELMIPIVLGEPLSYSFDAAYSAPGGGPDALAWGIYKQTATFSFVEADGITPVSITPAPEPTTWVLILTSLLLLATARRRVRFASI